MSIVKKVLWVYSNLPSGGAKKLMVLNNKLFKKKYIIKYITDSFIKPRNFLDYLYLILCKVPIIHRDFSSKIDVKNDVLIANHTWLTKSPHILRYYSGKKIYICHEAPREYYDEKHKLTQTVKDRIINILRYPIKFIDKKNLNAHNLIVVANSIYSKKIIDSVYGINSTVIYPGIDLKEFKDLNSNNKKEYKVLSVGAVNRLKGHDFVIKVVSRIDKKIRPKLLIIGNGGDSTYVSELKKSAKKLGVRLQIKINVSRKVLLSEYSKSLAFIYSPVSEPFGIVILEALASGLPIIAKEGGGGYTEIISDRNGYILDELDMKVWGKSLTKILIDDKLRNKFKIHNIIEARKFDQSKMNNQLLKIIRNL